MIVLYSTVDSLRTFVFHPRGRYSVLIFQIATTYPR